MAEVKIIYDDALKTQGIFDKKFIDDFAVIKRDNKLKKERVQATTAQQKTGSCSD